MRFRPACFVVSTMLATLATVSGCGQNSLGDPTGSTCPSGSTLTYDNFGKAFFATNCLSCHAAQEVPHFNSVDQIRAAKDDIDRAAASGPDTTNTYMPEDADVPDAERKQLGEWLACGAP